MRVSAALALTALAFSPVQSEAQVSGEIAVDGYPVGGYIRFGDRPRYVEVARPRSRGSRVVVVERYAPPRVIVVERWQKHKHHKHWRQDRRYRRGFVFYDRRHDRYYDSYRPGLIEIRVVIRDGRYYRYDDRDRYDRDRDYRDRDYRDRRDRDRRYDDDWDDRWDDDRRDDRRYDDRWNNRP